MSPLVAEAEAQASRAPAGAGSEALATDACVHCGLPVPGERQPSPYCCQGCETVAAFLGDAGLDGYYARRSGPAPAPSQPSGRAYEELDDPAFLERHAQVEARQGEEVQAYGTDLYLEGTHCAACVWLVEKLPSLVPGVSAARLDLSRGVARVQWDPREVPLSEVARTLDSIGYPAHPYRAGERAARRQEAERAALVRLAVAGALAGNVMLISFASYGGIMHGMEPAIQSLFRWFAFALCLPAVFGPGRTFLRGAWAALTTRTPHVDLPVSLALLAGLAGGLVSTIRGVGEVYFDTVSVLVFLLLIGRWLQGRQRRRAAESTELLTALAPSAARRLEVGPEGERAREVPLETLRRGERVEVRGGERVPVDGSVLDGRSRLDRSLLTGEARPVAVGPGDRVHAGTINRGGRLVIEVEATGEETRLASILRQVEAVGARKAPVVAWADRVAGTFVLVVLVLGLLTFLGWQWAAPARALDHAVALLIVTCPCALGLATPLAVHAALGRAARLGAIVKGGEVLQRLAGEGAQRPRGPLALLDKTGTLTEASFRLRTWRPEPSEDEAAVRAALLALEETSAHPIADGFREAWAGTPAGRVEGTVEELPGGGLRGRVAGEVWEVGSPAACGGEAQAAELVARGETPVVIRRGGRRAALAGLGDGLRPEAAGAVAELQSAGWRVELLSGDHPEVVAAVGSQLGVSAAQGATTPEGKAARVEAARSEGYGPILVVGDGVNDAAALAAADVGVGVRGGSVAALEAADVYLTQPGVGALRGLVSLAGGTLGRIRLNLALSLAYNLIAAALAASGQIDPIVAAILMPLSSLFVVANSYRGALREQPGA